MNTNDEKEVERVLSNPESIIMSKGLEDIISIDGIELPKSYVTISGNDYPIHVFEMVRRDSGVEVTFSIDNFSIIEFIDNSDLLFNLSDRVFAADIISYKEIEHSVMSVFLRNV